MKDHRLVAPRGTGMCARCRHGRVIESGKGSRFMLCERSQTDEDYPRYPILPVFQCEGFEDQVQPPEEP